MIKICQDRPRFKQTNKYTICEIIYFQAAQDRLNKVHQSCLKETAKRRTLLEPSPPSK
jgi:hypothetical protein